MRRCCKVSRVLTAGAALLIWTTVPVWMGGCGTSAVPTASPAAGTMPGIAGNQRPSFSFVTPDRGVTISVGAIYTISWIDNDPDDDALIDLVLDPDQNHDSGNELLILGGRSEDADTLEDDSFEFDTSAVPVGNYYLRAIIDDGVNAPVLVNAPDGFGIVSEGTASLNQPPQVTVTAPAANRSVAQDDVLVIRWEDQDVDSNALVLVTLDRDSNRNNDDVQDDSDTGRILLHQTLEDPDPDPADPNDPNADADTYLLTVDVTEIPVREDGKPYYVKVTLVDGINPPVHAYAPGEVYVLSLAKPTFVEGAVKRLEPLDLGQVGTVISGATWRGFHPSGWTGSLSRTGGDFDADGADDFVLVSRFGNPENHGPLGQAYVVYGLPPVAGAGSTRGERFGGMISVNEISNEVSGVVFQAPHDGQRNPRSLVNGGSNEGIADVGFIPDVTGDGRPELLVGTPYVDGILQSRDDDPGDTVDVREFDLSLDIQTIVRDSHTATGDFTDLGDNCFSPELVVGPAEAQAAVIQITPSPAAFADLQSILFPQCGVEDGGEVENALLQLALIQASQDLDVEVVSVFDDPTEGAQDPCDPASVFDLEADGAALQVDVAGFIELDVTEYVEFKLCEGVESGFIPSFTFLVKPSDDPEPDEDPAFIRLRSFEGGGLSLGPRLVIELNAEDRIGGCYSDLYPNNFGTQEADDLAPEEFGVPWIIERLGCAFVVNSSNRDDDPAIADAPRFEQTTINLEDVGQQLLGRGIHGAEDPVLEDGGRISGSRIQVGLYDWWEELFLGAMGQAQGPIRADFGRTVDCLPDMTNDGVSELIISAPRNESDVLETIALHGVNASHFHGRSLWSNVQVLIGMDFSALGEDFGGGDQRRGDAANSVIPYLETNSATCGDEDDLYRDHSVHEAGWPPFFEISGEHYNDQLGYARFAGDYDLDQVPDIALGAPLADVNTWTDAGKAYVLFGTPGPEGLGEVKLSDLDDPVMRPPTVRIMGEHPGDHLGALQGVQQDFDGDGVDDVLIASGDYDWAGMEDAGAVAILLGGRLTQSDADYDYFFSEIGSQFLPGIILHGANPGDRAGTGTVVINEGTDNQWTVLAQHGASGSAFYAANGDVFGADFNGDGLGDLLIAAPGTQGFPSGTPRLGVVYLIYGREDIWDHVTPANNVYELDPVNGDVGTSRLPGMVFASPYAPPPDADSAAPSSVAFLGDINADGFADIMIGNPLADYVSEVNPQARRPDAGEAYLIYGNNAGCNDPGNWFTEECFGESEP